MRPLIILTISLAVTCNCYSQQHRLDSTYTSINFPKSNSERTITEKFNYFGNNQHSLDRKTYRNGSFYESVFIAYEDSVIQRYEVLYSDSTYWSRLYYYDELGRERNVLIESKSGATVEYTSYLAETNLLTRKLMYRYSGSDSMVTRYAINRYDSVSRLIEYELLKLNESGDTTFYGISQYSYEGDSARWSHIRYWYEGSRDTIRTIRESLSRTILGDTIFLLDTVKYMTTFEGYSLDSVLQNKTVDVTYEWGLEDRNKFRGSGRINYRDSTLTGSFSEYEISDDKVYEKVLSAEPGIRDLDPEKYREHLRNDLELGRERTFYLGEDDRIEKESSVNYWYGMRKSEVEKLYFYEESTSVEDDYHQHSQVLTIIHQLDSNKMYFDYSGRVVGDHARSCIYLIEISNDRTVKRVFYIP